MSLSDPIGDMLARLKNSQMRNHKKIELPSSKFKAKIAEILKSEGYIIDYEVKAEQNKANLHISLKYNSGNPDFKLKPRMLELHEAKDYGKYAQGDELWVCFSGSNHTTGGNSGSPVLDADGYLPLSILPSPKCYDDQWSFPLFWGDLVDSVRSQLVS